MATQFRARSVIDLGCGTGILARRLAGLGFAVIGADPARGSLEYARTRPDAHQVGWILGDATALPVAAADLVLMTGNAAQAIVKDADWTAMLQRTRAALRPDGRLVFETRDPSRRAWESWTPGETFRRVPIAEVGWVRAWTELTSVHLPLISFRTTWIFESDGAVLPAFRVIRLV
jgi:SAM-dependent methyltransferase